jgi:hypothetical protein
LCRRVLYVNDAAGLWYLGEGNALGVFAGARADADAFMHLGPAAVYTAALLLALGLLPLYSPAGVVSTTSEGMSSEREMLVGIDRRRARGIVPILARTTSLCRTSRCRSIGEKQVGYEDDDSKPVWPTWAVDTLALKSARCIHINYAYFYIPLSLRR